MRAAVGGIALALVASGALAVGTEGFVRLAPAALAWQDLPGSPGVRFARLHGDSRHPGIYVERLRFPPGIVSAPHAHPHDRHVTVIEGTWLTGTGRRVDSQDAVPLPPGSYMFHPGGAVHWDGAGADGPVTVQVIGQGPATATPTDPSGGSWVRLPGRPDVR